MITFYSGTPGSGKSLHMAQDIMEHLRYGRNVISTVDINLDIVTKKGRKKIARFTYEDIFNLSPDYFYKYAREHHKRGKEGQTIVFLDECQLIFNVRETDKKDRLDWCKFFTHHRHLGFHFVLVAQYDKMVDKQIRCLFEHEVKHRKVNNFALFWLLPFKVFVAVTVWYGMKLKEGSKFFIFRRKFARLYDTFALWDFGADKGAPVLAAPDDAPVQAGSDAGARAGIKGPPPPPAPPRLFGRLFGRAGKGGALSEAGIKM